MTYEYFDTIRHSLPEEAGVYRYYDEQAKLLYVGKAKNLRKRVASYFTNKRYEGARIRMLVAKIFTIEYTLVSTEQDALLLENSLIKEHQPKYNVQLKDDKTYPYVCIKNEDFPRVFITRNFERDGSEYFGPYTSVSRVRIILDVFLKAFPLRNCNLNLTKKNIDSGKFKVCLEYHIGNCLGPCVAKQTKESYDESIKQIRLILKGNISWVIDELNLKMNEHASNFEFEKANYIKEKLLHLQSYMAKSTIVNPKLDDIDIFALATQDDLFFVNYMKLGNGSIIATRTFQIKKKNEESAEEILQSVIDEIAFEADKDFSEIVTNINLDEEWNAGIKTTLPLAGDKKKLIDLAYRNAQYALKEKLTQLIKIKNETPALRILTQAQVDLRLKEMPIHIECFDNSNIQGTNPVSACVVFKNARPSKKDYRHFKIKTVEGPNDFASMEEAVYRRYKRMIDEDQKLPQLVIIDGGKGQLSSAMKSIEKLGLNGKMAVIGIAKRLEELYYPDDSLPLYIDKKSETLKLIQKLRDEAHRFGLSFHRKLRSKSALVSELDDIKGIGEETKKEILTTYKTLSNLKNANLDELKASFGNHKACILYEFLNKEDLE
jgi:excinuclease ABC subunit C